MMPENSGAVRANTRYWGHHAVDMRNGLGDSVQSVYAGVVVGAGPTSSGNFVEVWNYDGSVSRYVHVTASVSVGAEVQAGTTIGRTDLSGGVKDAHLHYAWKPSVASSFANPTAILGPLAPGARGLMSRGASL